MRRIAFLVPVLLAVFAAGFLRAAEPPEVTAMRAKAEKGNGLAQYNLGLVYATGDGVTADLPEAFVWLSLASENGATGKALDRVLGNITDAQLAEGRRRLADYRAALAAKASLATQPSAHRPANRGFSLTALPNTDPGINPEPDALVTHPPEPSSNVSFVPSAGRLVTPAPNLDEHARLTIEVAQLKADLAQANERVQQQTALIAELKDQLAKRPALPPTTLPAAPRTSPPDGR